MSQDPPRPDTPRQDPAHRDPSRQDTPFGLPVFHVSDRTPEPVPLETVVHPDGRLSQYPPRERWADWVEWDAKAWPRRVARNYTLVPTICFNCESACGLLAYVDRETLDIRKFEGNPAHPGSRGRNCAKGPATLNQVYDPERILFPLKRVGARGEGEWERISWEQALEEIAAKLRESRARRRDGIMYHVGRPGEDGFTNRVLQAWGVDGHNSHTNICSAGARAGYAFWTGEDRPSPDHANARVILLLSAHLESGHYFNPHAQRIMEGMEKGAKLITFDPRLSNTAAKSDLWLPTWPGSEATVLLAMAAHLIRERRHDRAFMKRWVNWRETVEHFSSNPYPELDFQHDGEPTFEAFETLLEKLYGRFTFERAARESGVPAEQIQAAAEAVADCQGRLATHVWRGASIGNLGGWQVSRCLFFLNVLTGSVGTRGGTSMNAWNKFVPRPFDQPPPVPAWNELEFPQEWPLSHYEMSFLLPHMLMEGRGTVDVYFTRVYNPLWINPDGFMWMEALRDEEKMGCHVALTPTWNETAYFADYVLPMGHAGERHDLMSQETHAGQWIGFRQPVRRVAMERAGTKVRWTWEANPGEVWEENEFWVELSVRMDPDGSLGIRKHFESPYRPGEIVTVEEYYRWIFENSVPGLPEAAAEEGLTPLEYMRRYGAFEIKRENYTPFEAAVSVDGAEVDAQGRVSRDGKVVGVVPGVDPGKGTPPGGPGGPGGPASGDPEDQGEGACTGFPTPSRRLEFFASTLRDWGWKDLGHVIPWTLRSHVDPGEIDREKGEMLLLPNFRLPTLIHTRSANSKWLYELSHRNPVWLHPEDAARLKVETGDLVRVDTEIGHLVDRVWITEGLRPGVLALSHHLGRWRLKEGEGVNPSASSLVRLERPSEGVWRVRILKGGGAYESFDPDTSRVWWKDVGVHQNLTHGVHPDPISGAHCWHQKAVRVRKAEAGEELGDVVVDTAKSMEIYRRWKAMARPALEHSPDGMRRPRWLKRPLAPAEEAWRLPEK
ncbi:MAG: formate dehydrogenase [Gemmatimonadales bacterium]|nr:MAG: formate dehydrogenase [Gemmatimonadales bacterium]